jgi:dUTP pyrophosphatase
MKHKSYIKRIDSTLPLPEYKTRGAAGFDLSSREGVVIAPHAVIHVPLNVIVAPPEGCFTLLVPRSSLHKKGLMPSNGAGIIDADYCGESDELKAALYNFTDTEVTIAKGERIMQGVFIPYVRGEFEEVETMSEESRGGFGTTGR